MPRRSVAGTSLGLSSRCANRLRAARSQKFETVARARKIETLESRLLLSQTWYVAPSGSDAGAGTLASPFRTIQEGANAANSGDAVAIEGGSYHETVTPPHGGVSFENYNGQTVTVSGADLISGFSQKSGSIYQTSLPFNLGEGNNQVFVDGQMMNEARFPNTSLDPLHPTQEAIQSLSGNTIYDSNLNQPSGYWTGALIHITPGQGWVSYSGTVTNSGPGWISIAGLPSLSSWETPTAGNQFYLYGKYQALDTAGEFYIDSSNTLSLWDPQSDNPNGHDVEVKHRQWAFDLSNVSNTIIQGINIFAASIHTGYSSTNTVLNQISASYIDQLGWISNGWSIPEPWGIELLGANSTLENSTIAYSAGDGVFVGANNCTVTSNLIHDVDYGAIDAAGVRIMGQYAMVSHNTIYNAGRDGINFQAGPETITNNLIHNVMLQTTDGGGIYTVHTNGQGTVIAGNQIYNVTSGGFGADGIFLDNNSSNMIVHDNTVWNTNAALKLNYTSYNEQVYTNELSGNPYSVANNGTYDWSGSQFYNNTYSGEVDMGANASQWGNTTGTISPSPTNVAGSPSPVTAPTPNPGGSSGGSSSPVAAGSTIQGLSYNSASNVGSYAGAVGMTYNGSWVEYNNVDFGTGGYTQFACSIAVGQGYQGQQMVLHLDSPTGTTIGTLVTTATGSWLTYATESTPISSVSGVHNLYITFVGGQGIADLLSFSFAGSSSASPSGGNAGNTITGLNYNSANNVGSYDGAVGMTYNGSWVEYNNIDFANGGYTRFVSSIAVGQGYQGQQMVLHLDSPTGPTMGTLITTSTGSWLTYGAQSTSIGNVTGVHNVYVVFVGGQGIADLLSFNFA
jgi:hypothetical protein